MARKSLLLATSALLLGMCSGVQPVPRINLTDARARCMDGTLGAYYHEPASSPDATRQFIIFLEGGGECVTQAACYAALNTSLGSSNFFKPEIYMPYEFMSSDATINADFWGWNHIDVPYCSQDLHSGQRSAPSVDTWGLWFSGHTTFTAVLDALDSTSNLAGATEIIIAGASAGGIGAFINVDYVARRYPGARVSGVTFAGFYFYAQYYNGPNHTTSALADFREAAWPQHYELWQSYANEACVKARPADPWACLLANYSLPHVYSPMFVAEAQTDEVVLEAHDCLPGEYRTLPPERAFMEQWHANMTTALAPLYARYSGNGVFNPACYIHTNFRKDGPLIRNISYLTALGNWYFERTGVDGYLLADSCGIECNPTCPPGP